MINLQYTLLDEASKGTWNGVGIIISTTSEINLTSGLGTHYLVYVNNSTWWLLEAGDGQVLGGFNIFYATNVLASQGTYTNETAASIYTSNDVEDFLDFFITNTPG